jgi:hypothetical protein
MYIIYCFFMQRKKGELRTVIDQIILIIESWNVWQGNKGYQNMLNNNLSNLNQEIHI